MVRALRARIYQGDDEELAGSWRKRHKYSAAEYALSRAMPFSRACAAMKVLLDNRVPLFKPVEGHEVKLHVRAPLA